MILSDTRILEGGKKTIVVSLIAANAWEVIAHDVHLANDGYLPRAYTGC